MMAEWRRVDDDRYRVWFDNDNFRAMDRRWWQDGGRRDRCDRRSARLHGRDDRIGNAAVLQPNESVWTGIELPAAGANRVDNHVLAKTILRHCHNVGVCHSPRRDLLLFHLIGVRPSRITLTGTVFSVSNQRSAERTGCSSNQRPIARVAACTTDDCPRRRPQTGAKQSSVPGRRGTACHR